MGVLLRGTKKDDVERGQVLAKPGSITPHTKFKGEVYVLTKEEGGRHTPFFKGYRPQFYFRTTDVTGVATLPEGAEMVMPGDNVNLTIELITPIAMEKGCASRFARAAAPSAPAPSPKSSSKRDSTAVEAVQVENRGLAMLNEKIRIRLKAYDHRILDTSTPRSSTRLSGPARGSWGRFRCRRISRATPCNRSPHVDKKSREQFEIRTHKRLLDIYEPTSRRWMR